MTAREQEILNRISQHHQNGRNLTLYGEHETCDFARADIPFLLETINSLREQVTATEYRLTMAVSELDTLKYDAALDKRTIADLVDKFERKK